MTAELWKRRSVLKSWAISRTRRWKGSFLIKSSVDFWYRRISRRATVPGLRPKICNPSGMLKQENKQVKTLRDLKLLPNNSQIRTTNDQYYVLPVSMWLLYTPRSRSRLPCSFCSQLFARSFPSCRLSSGLLGSSYLLGYHVIDECS